MVEFLKKNSDKILIFFLIAFLYGVSPALTPFFIGITISYISLPIISLMTDRWKYKKGISITISVLAIYGLLIASVILFIPFLYDRLSQITKSIMSFNLESIKINQELTILLAKLKEMVIAKIPGYATSIAQKIISSTQSLISLVFSFIFAPLISIYFLMDVREKSHPAIKYLDNLAAHFVKVQLLMIVFYTLSYFTLLTLLNINEAITLSIIAGILYVLPYIGPITGCTILCLMAASQYGFDFHVIVIMITFLLINILDVIFINPRLIGPKFGLHPLMTIFSLLVSSYLFGVVGMILAIPIAVIMKDFSKRVFHK